MGTSGNAADAVGSHACLSRYGCGVFHGRRPRAASQAAVHQFRGRHVQKTICADPLHSLRNAALAHMAGVYAKTQQSDSLLPGKPAPGMVVNWWAKMACNSLH